MNFTKGNKMEFEYIDESEIQFTERVKKTKSLFDSPLIDRSYWGDDVGSELTMALGRNRIRKSIKNLKLFNVDDDELTRKLIKKYRDELRMYQIEMLSVLITQDKYEIVQDCNGEMLLQLVTPFHLIEEEAINN